MEEDKHFQWIMDDELRLELLKQICASECISVDEVIYINPQKDDSTVGEVMLNLYERNFIDAKCDESLPSYLPQNYYFATKKGELTLKKANKWNETKEFKQKLETLACVDYIKTIREKKPSL
jgi:hypothetical protein